MNGDVIAEWEDATGLMWRRVVVDSPEMKGEFVQAVCRPESCADGHRCGKLDLGIVREP